MKDTAFVLFILWLATTLVVWVSEPKTTLVGLIADEIRFVVDLLHRIW